MTLVTLYEPLQDIEYFRLLRVSRDPTTGVISGDLQNFLLSSRSCPRFISFSYAWGSSTTTRTIKLHDHDVAVIESVYRLLEVICDGGARDSVPPNAWLWIDSICINQADWQERGLQVSLMGKIYRQSRRTIVWLGEATPETDEGMDFMHELVRENTALVQHSKETGFRIIPDNLKDPDKWKALAAVLERPWWRRVWTLQEYIIAPHLDFYCGTKSISRTRLRTALYSLWLCKPGEKLIKDESWNPAWTRRRLLQWFQHDDYWDKMGLLALMAYSSGCAVTDPRDRVYGLLGLARDLDIQMVGRPSYDHDADTLYTNLVKSFVESYQSLDIICFAELFNGGLGLPSWVPDWSTAKEVFVIPLMVSQSGKDHIGNFRPIMNREDTAGSAPVYAAAAQELPQIVFSEDGRRLTCKGILIDHIDGLGGVEAPEDGGTAGSSDLVLQQSEASANLSEDKATSDHDDDRLGLLDALVRSLVLDRQDRYLSKSAPVDHFRQDLQQLVFLAAAEQGEDNDSSFASRRFLPWYRRSKNLLIRGGVSLEELCKPPSASSLADNMSALSIADIDVTEEGFVQRLHDTVVPKKMCRRLCTTKEGSVGMVPPQARREDAVCVLFGCSVPVLLRRCCEDGGSGAEDYRFVGECYLDGFMKGEALARSAEARDFVLR